jgi:hypothetical protein
MGGGRQGQEDHKMEEEEEEGRGGEGRSGQGHDSAAHVDQTPGSFVLRMEKAPWKRWEKMERCEGGVGASPQQSQPRQKRRVCLGTWLVASCT